MGYGNTYEPSNVLYSSRFIVTVLNLAIRLVARRRRIPPNLRRLVSISDVRKEFMAAHQDQGQVYNQHLPF